MRKGTPVTSHLSIKKIPDGFVFFETLDDQFGSRRTGGCLNLHVRDAQPALKYARAQMNVLDTSISKIDLPAKQDAYFHMNTLRIKTIAQRVITKIEIRETRDDPGAGENGDDDIICPKRGMRPFQGKDLLRNGGLRDRRRRAHQAEAELVKA